MRGSKTSWQRFIFVYSHQCISQRAVWTSLEKQLNPMGPIASRGVSVPELLRKPIASCDFPGVGGVGFYQDGQGPIFAPFFYLVIKFLLTGLISMSVTYSH